jgi:hypothetical protein
MNGEVQLIVGANAQELQLNTIGLISGASLVNPVPWGIINSNPTVWTIGSQLLLVDSSDPETWTVLATLTVVSVDTIAETFDFTTGDYIDPDVIYNFAFYTNATVGSQAYIDLFENESISQNWKFQDLNNFTAQGSFSREFRVPYSENNQQALGALFDVNVTAGAENYFHYKLPAEIRVDTLPIATGYIRVRKVYRQQNRINEVELAFYAETPDLVRVIGEKKLSDITDLINLDEVVSYSTVAAPNAQRIWTLLDRGQRWSENNEPNTRPLTNAGLPVYASDFTPALSWWYLFENIVKDAGFELVAGTLQTILSDYWMPFCNSRILASDASNGAYNFYVYNTSTFVVPQSSWGIVPMNTIAFDNNGDYNGGTNTYTVPTTGFYSFTIRLNMTVTGSSNLNVGFRINGVSQQVAFFNVFNTTENIQFNQTAVFYAGDTVQLVVNKTNQTATVTIAASTGSITESFWNLNAVNASFGQILNYSQNAPDMKQIDFVTDVIKMHNCAIVPDRAIPNRIYVVPQNSYLGSGNVLDWTSKLDVSKDITLSSTVDLQKAKFQFTYASGDDIVSRQYKNANRIYGDYEAIGYTVNPNTASSDFAIGDQQIQLVTRSTPSAVINGNGYVMPVFLNDQLEFSIPGPRCLYQAGTVNIQMFNDSTSTIGLYAASVLNNYSQVYAEIDDYDLNWAPEVPAHAINTNPYYNLFNLYWRTYMNSLYNPEARIMEANFALELTDILTFSFADKIWIQDSYWRIIEISDYKVGMLESTKVTLLKFLEDTEDCSARPASVTISGSVQFVDADNNPVPATQDCCSRYGYTWDEANGICWGASSFGERPAPPVTGSVTNPATTVIDTVRSSSFVTNSTINGNDVVVAVGNRSMLAVGDRLELTKDTGGSNLLGKNTYTNLPGIHIGGGWKDGTSVSVEKGWSQHGIVMLHRKESWLTSGTNFAYYIEGVAGEYIELPNDTVWSAMLNVTVIDAGNNYYTGQFSLAMQKVGGIAAVSALTAINQINNTAYTFTVGVNVAINTAQHRLYLNVAGGGTFPANLITTASIQYQQSKIS